MDSPASKPMADSSPEQPRPVDTPTPPVPPVMVSEASPEGKPAVAPTTARSPELSSDNPLFNWVIPLLILASGVIAVFAFGKLQPPEKPPEDMSPTARLARLPEVQVLPVRSLDAIGGKLDLGVDGTVVPYREIEIASQVAGQIVYKDPLCEVGSYVEKDQLLIRVDRTDYENEVARLTQQKEQEYQAIRELDQDMTNTNRLLSVAEQDVELRQREVERLKSLPEGFASPAELDAAERARLQSVNSKVTLENQLAAMRQRRNRLQAAEALAATQLEMAETNLGRTEIRAPVSGVIYREDAELNSFVQRGQVVFTIEDTERAEVVVNLRPDQLYWVLSQRTDTSAGSVASGESGEATESPLQIARRNYQLPPTNVWVYYQVAGRESERYRWQGTLETYDGIGVDPTSRTVPVRVIVNKPSEFKIVDQQNQPIDAVATPFALVRGMFVSVVLRIEPHKPLVIIPGVALKPGNDGNRVWKFEPAPNALAEQASVVTAEVGENPDTEKKTNAPTAQQDPENADKPNGEEVA